MSNRPLSKRERFLIEQSIEAHKHVLERQVRAKTRNRNPRIRKGRPSIEFKPDDVEILLSLVSKGYGKTPTQAARRVFQLGLDILKKARIIR